MMSRSKETTHKIMSSIKNKDTRPELALRKELWRRKYRYRVNYKKLPGKPDIVFTKYRVVVFCDGDFWHGHNWAVRGLTSFEEEIEGYSDYWRAKITRNVERDSDNDRKLNALGWKVVHVWESDIKKDLDGCVRTVEEAILDSKLSSAEIEEEDAELW